jgi:hypothetical protein
MWNVIASQVDVNHLMQTFGNFHDSCLKELAVQNREFVDAELSMSFDNKTFVRMLFQRQFNKASAIEMVFDDVVDFNWVQDERNSDPGMSIILQAVCLWQNDTLYWAEDIDWQINGEDKNDYRWIAAKSGRWRIIESGLGPKTILFHSVDV